MNSSREGFLVVNESKDLSGCTQLAGSKNASLVIMALLILTEEVSVLYNVPDSLDVRHMIEVLRSLGAQVSYDASVDRLEVDTAAICGYTVARELMHKMRASVIVMGPLLARFGKAEIALPGGCVIGARPIDMHLKNFQKMGVHIVQDGTYLSGTVTHLKSQHMGP